MANLAITEIYPIGSPLQWISDPRSGDFTLIPILTVSASLVNWLITLGIKPRILPKLIFKDEIPALYQTLVVIPALITSHKEIDNLTHQLEMHFLRNPEPGLLFALLTDFVMRTVKPCLKMKNWLSMHPRDLRIECKIWTSIPDSSRRQGTMPLK